MDNQQPSINNALFYQKPKDGYGFIYKYTSPNNQSYIGQTVNSLAYRAVNLISGTGYKKCTVFWKAIQKYGWNNFKATILEEVPLEELNQKEIYYISKFNTLVPNGYNVNIGGEGGKRREVYVYSAQNGCFLEHYSSLSEASNITGVPITTISVILSDNDKKNRKSAHNLVFLDYYTPKYDINKLNRKNHRKTFVYDRNGNFLKEYSSATEAAKDLNIGYTSILKCLSKKRRHASYYQFLTEKKDKIEAIPKNSKTPISVCQVNPETQQVIAVFPSYAAAARAVGLTGGHGIKRVVEREKGLSGGFFWKVNEGSTTK